MSEEVCNGIHKIQYVLDNQIAAIRYLTEYLKNIDQNCMEFDNSVEQGEVVRSESEGEKKIIDNRSKIYNLVNRISSSIREPCWYSLITKCNDVTNKRFMVSNVRLPDEIYGYLGLGDSVCLGTLGRYKVKVGEPEKIVKSENSNRIVLVLQCDIHNSQQRWDTLNNLKNFYLPLYKKFNCHDIVLYSTSQNISAFDVEYAHKIHKSHSHWGMEATVNFARNIYRRFPDSIILSHPYIISHLLDNKIYLNYDCSCMIDNKKSLQRSFSNILRWLANEESLREGR